MSGGEERRGETRGEEGRGGEWRRGEEIMKSVQLEKGIQEQNGGN